MSDDAVIEQALARLAAGRRVALATVIKTWTWAPRPLGSHMAVDDTGAVIGSVAGGCIEGAVVTQALHALEDGEPRLLSFLVSDPLAWEAGLAGGGQIELLVEPIE